MRRVILAALMLLALAPAGRAQELRVGTVDLQRALNESEAGKKAKEQFKVEVDKLQADLAKQKGDIEKIKEDVEKKGLVLKEEERR
ncbi:MAG: OmpH family outer membrane protein, partial [Candidatus Binatia bacterium]